jgi:hypothetical protein
LEEGRPGQRRTDKASEEGQSPPRAVELMMMTMMKNYIIRSTLLHFSAEISCILSRLTPIHDILDEAFLPEFFQHFSSSYWAFSVIVHIIFHLMNRQRSSDLQNHTKRSKVSRLKLPITAVHIRPTILHA